MIIHMTGKKKKITFFLIKIQKILTIKERIGKLNYSKLKDHVQKKKKKKCYNNSEKKGHGVEDIYNAYM